MKEARKTRQRLLCAWERLRAPEIRTDFRAAR
jgi:hypothetical protein